MKKFALLNIVNILLLLIFVTLLLLQKCNPIVPINFDDFWFSILIITFGVSLIFKALIFKSDSSTWFGVLFLTNGCVLLTSYLKAINYSTLWPTILSSIMLSSLIVAIFFKDWFHCRIFIMFLIVSVVCYLYSFKIINLGWFIGFAVLSVVLAFMVAKLIPVRFSYIKKEK